MPAVVQTARVLTEQGGSQWSWKVTVPLLSVLLFRVIAVNTEDINLLNDSL